MKKHVGCVGVLLALAGLAGCFTVSETEYPQVPMGTLSATNVTVAVRGFEATVTDVVLVGGWTTVYVPGYPGHHHWHPGGYQPVHTTTAVPQVRATEAYLGRARDCFEQVGFGIMASQPDYIVEGSFTGPYVADGASAWRLVRNVCSLFTYDRSEAAWKGLLKVYDNRTGRLVLRREYEQSREISVFSPIPLFGISHCEQTGYGHLKAWCLSALTDRMTADAIAFLSTQGSAAK